MSPVRRRGWVVAAVVAAVLLVLVVAADLLARSYAERQVAAEVQRVAELPSAPEVDFPGGSFLLQALGGDFDHVRVIADEASREGITGRHVEVRLEQVTAPREVLLGRGGTISAEGGRAWALVPFSSLEERVARDWQEVAIERNGSGVAVSRELEVLGQEQRVTVSVDVELDEDVVVLTPTEAAASEGSLDLQDVGRTLRRLGIESPLDGVPVPLRGLPPQVRLERLTVTDEGLRLSARLDALDVPVEGR